MQYNAYKRSFHLSHTVIWCSALCIGVLASVPKLLRLHLAPGELLTDISIATFFTAAAWYYNLRHLPAYTSKATPLPFFGPRLFKSLGLGILLMVVLVMIHQAIITEYNLLSMMLMYQFRGLVINLTVFLFLHLLYQQYVNTLLQRDMDQVEADKVNAQFELLKQQVNPHFLFNSLNTLKSMVDVQDTQASHFIITLSDFYRAALEKQPAAMIPMQTEITTLETYLHLLRYRFEEGIDVFINLCEAHQHSFIPPFTLQLLIENCIKHNIVSLEMPLYISIYSDGDYITVENRLQPKRGAQPGTRTGLANISQRYQHLTGQPLQVEQTERAFLVRLPVTPAAIPIPQATLA